MKKYIFFQIGILVSLLIPITSIFGQIIPKFGSVQLTYPIDNSVFQQNTSGSANIPFAGQILKGTYGLKLFYNQLSIILKIHHIVLFRLVIKELAGRFSLCFILFPTNIKQEALRFRSKGFII